MVDEVAVGMGGGKGLEAAGSSGSVNGIEGTPRVWSLGRERDRVVWEKRASRADEDWNPRRAERERERGEGTRGGRGASSPLAMPIYRRLAENQTCSWSDKKLS